MNLELGLYVFMLATFLGLELIRKVSPLLHTPLMSLTNAISAISVVGAILITGAQDATTLSKMLGFIAITAAVTNIVSGFLITDRMLKMFKKRGGEEVNGAMLGAVHLHRLGGAVHSVAEVDELARHGAARRVRGRNRHAAGRRRARFRCAARRIVNSQLAVDLRRPW